MLKSNTVHPCPMPFPRVDQVWGKLAAPGLGFPIVRANSHLERSILVPAPGSFCVGLASTVQPDRGTMVTLGTVTQLGYVLSCGAGTARCKARYRTYLGSLVL